MKIQLLIAAVVCSAGVCAKAQTFNPLLAAMLQDTLHTYVSQISNIKGTSVSVYVPGQGIWQGAEGMSQAGQPITPAMKFGIASNTKLFVSTAMLILAENNIINLNDSLRRWLPPYPNVNPNITIRQLLNHTSGVSDPIFVSPLVDTIKAYPTRVFTPNEVLNYLGAPTFAPGAGWSYSNVNYILAGMIAQSATGFHISEIIRDSILTPLNLQESFYDVREATTGVLVHRWWNGVDYHDTSRVSLNTAGGAAGAIFSTSSEMAQWYAALFSERVLNQSSMAELTTFSATSNPSYQYGLGLARETTQGLTYYTHGGDTWGYKSKMMHDPCLGTNVCVLSNSFPSGISAVAFLLYRVVKNHIPGCCGAISGMNVVCAGTSVTYAVPPIPNATSYSWTLPPGATGTSATNSITVNFGANSVSGSITVTGTNNYGPGGSSSLRVNVVPLPAAAIVAGGRTHICAGESVALSVASPGAGLGYQWRKNGVNIQGAVAADYSATMTGEYKVVIINASGCADSSIAVSVRVNPLPPANAGKDTAITKGRSVTLAASGGTAFLWNTGATTASITVSPTMTTTYSVRVSDSIGCSASDDVTVRVTGSTLSATAAAAPASICAGISTQLRAAAAGGTANATFSWRSVPAGFTSTEQNPAVAPTVSTVYTVTVADGADSATASVSVTVLELPAAATITQNQRTLTSSPASGYQWWLDGGEIPGATSQSYSPLKNGAYQVRITGQNGCFSNLSAVFNYQEPSAAQERGLSEQFSCYPNPTDGTITLAGSIVATGKYSVTVFDALGRNVFNADSTPLLRLAGLPNGCYYLEIRDDHGTTGRLITLYR